MKAVYPILYGEHSIYPSPVFPLPGNDHNEAVPFRKTGLRHEDMEVFRRYGIEL